MKAYCRVDDASKPSKTRKWVTRGCWLILLLVVVGLAIADAMS